MERAGLASAKFGPWLQESRSKAAGEIGSKPWVKPGSKAEGEARLKIL